MLQIDRVLDYIAMFFLWILLLSFIIIAMAAFDNYFVSEENAKISCDKSCEWRKEAITSRVFFKSKPVLKCCYRVYEWRGDTLTYPIKCCNPAMNGNYSTMDK